VNLRRHSVGIGPFAANAQPSADRGILSEEAFLRIISLERRRTERSRKPFLLMLVDIGDRVPSEGAGKILGKMVAALAVSTRETDVAGWYKTGCVVGVMFTEIGTEDRNSIVSTMIARLSTALRRSASRSTCSLRSGTTMNRSVPAIPRSTRICPNGPTAGASPIF